ncbi:MAG: glycosyltransferase family 2 protein [Bacteroidetes bacterium]|nr:MAG: glycosyltransferase family 2 protein [Bacteroidota bacterium]
MEVIFWTASLLVGYTYVGYGALLWLLVRLKRAVWGHPQPAVPDEWPPVTFLVAAWNEEDFIVEKLRNSQQFDYPADKLTIVVVTDGSTDRTPALVAGWQEGPFPVVLEHQPERKGKIAAVARVMPRVQTPVVVFSDANTHVNPQAIKNIVRHYERPEVGAVAGEKRIAVAEKGDAPGAGESTYWKYESALKRLDSELYTVVGAAGELFSIRTALYEPVPLDTIVEDFYMTTRIAMRGYRVVYEPQAWASERQSATIEDELTRKIRIAAGGLQAAWRLRSLLNPFRYGVLTFQYVSHRLLRWTLAPLALPVVFVSNAALVGLHPIYTLLFVGQSAFYALALAGKLLAHRPLRFKLLFVPYYFCVMNYAVYRGFFRLLSGKQSVLWEKARRAV